MRIIKTIPNEKIFFAEDYVEAGNMPTSSEGEIINVYDDVQYQEMLGFGGALTEASAYNYSLLSDDKKKEFIKAYFDTKDGIGYNFGRTHINSCDFSLDIYTNVAEGDKTLETFNIERDKKYIIPFVKDIIEYTGDSLVLFASPWSPPAYMKDNNSMIGGGKLLEEYKGLWAKYYAKYIKAYRAEGIKISAITVQNEAKAIQTWESCEYTPEEERDFIEKYLAPTLDEEGLSDIKIIIWDHNKERVYDRAKTIFANKKVEERVWAIGHHWYTGDHFEALSIAWEQLHKPNICTEFCATIAMKNDLTTLAERYGREICENINNYCMGICDWNVFLDSNGAPFHNRGKSGTEMTAIDFSEENPGCCSPVMLTEDKNDFELTPVYYYIGHFSKYVKRGAKRIAVTKYSKDLYACAFVNPDGQRLLVVMNEDNETRNAVIRYNNECTKIELSAHSIVTVLF